MMERLLRHPTWLKIFSVGLALLLWAMVIRQYTSDDTKVLEVPLQVIQHPDFQLQEGPRDRERFVTVRVDGKNLLVSRLTAEQVTARVDYSKVTEPGRPQVVEVEVAGPSNLKGLTYTATPRALTVELIKNQEALFPVVVVPESSVLPRENREWVWTAKPATPEVRLSGSSVVLETVRTARVILEPGDLVPNTTKVTKKVIPTDAEGKTVNLKEQTIDVLLTWTEQPPGKTFDVKPVTRGSPPAGLAVTSLTAEPASLQVRAATLGGTLPEQTVIETEPIDLTGRSKSFVTSARLIPPSGTTVSIPSVNVTVTLSEVVQERVLKGIPLALRGKAANTEITWSVTDVQVRVTGLYSAVTALDAGRVTAYVDVEGLEPGKHTLPVKVDAPQGISAAAIDPPTVEVDVVAP